MSTRIKIILGCAIVLIGLGAIAAGPTAVGLYRIWFPNDQQWDGKVGWRLCNGAIAAWPGKAAPRCEHLHMCANEGALTQAESTKLRAMVAATPGCDPL